jgi:hypothetical protein
MHPLTHPIRQPPHGKDVARAVKDERIALAQPLSGQNLILDREETRVVSLKCVRACHPSNNTPAQGASLSSGHPERSMDFTK